MKNATLKLLLLLALSWLLASCGGGGGQLPVGDNQPQQQQDQPQAEAPVVDEPADPTLLGDWRTVVYDQLPAPDAMFSPYADAAAMATAAQILALTNIERVAAGLNQLSGDVHLDRVATAHGLDMATHSFFAHDNLYRMAPWNRLDDINPPMYVAAGENIAGGQSTAEAAMQGWMESAGHRENILRDIYTHLGVGVYYDEDSPYGVYYVQMFAAFPGDPDLNNWYEQGD